MISFNVQQFYGINVSLTMAINIKILNLIINIKIETMVIIIIIIGEIVRDNHPINRNHLKETKWEEDTATDIYIKYIKILLKSNIKKSLNLLWYFKKKNLIIIKNL